VGAGPTPYNVCRNLGQEVFIMLNIKILKEIYNQFGLKYVAFRAKYEISRLFGADEYKFPKEFVVKQFVDISSWKGSGADTFIIPAKEEFDKTGLNPSAQLQDQLKKILNGEILFFNFEWKFIGFENDWHQHPVSKTEYHKNHWTKIQVYDKESGDIKYVWEKSKFSYLQYIIRNDLHNNQDHSSFVFGEINRWIDENLPNTGPQYVCSQEIAIRLLNWCFALFFYKNSTVLDQQLLNKILTSVSIQTNHIFNNINFSKIAVRNNHAVTETLTLYLMGLYFPFLPNAKKYKQYGKKWFEGEIAYQMFEDGTDSQYSFNYHRVKIQLLSFAISSAMVNKEKFDQVVYDRAKNSLNFLYQQIGNFENGNLPNYGPNDGSIYFKLNSCDYTNYLPQLNALAALLNLKLDNLPDDKEITEDAFWFTSKIKHDNTLKELVKIKQGVNVYQDGGYVQIRDERTMSLFKTPESKFRAAQNDLLHLDIWVDGVNIFRDAGSYLYNTTKEYEMFFTGVQGHNTVAVEGENHMLKGPRFMWLYKPVHKGTKVIHHDQFYEIISLMELNYPEKLTIQRTIKKYKSALEWEIEDQILEKSDKSIEQYFNINPISYNSINIDSFDGANTPVIPIDKKAYFSKYYGYKEESILKTYVSKNGYIKTIIKFRG